LAKGTGFTGSFGTALIT